MSAALIELHSLPCLEYFCALSRHDLIVLEKHEHFVKQTCRNRFYILAANRQEMITLPLAGRHGKMLITDIQLETSQRWRRNTWRTLNSAYASSPYFEHYADELSSLISSGKRYLYDLNLELLSLCLRWLRWSKPVTETNAYQKSVDPEITDLRDVISGKKDFRERAFYDPIPYRQVFGSTFAPNLSLVDLVFSAGPSATVVIEGSAKKTVNK